MTYHEKNRLEYKYISRTIYGRQLNSSKERGHNPPAYTLEELRYWMQQQDNLSSLMKAYKESNGDSNLKPSVDRKKDHLPYTFDNIQLGTWKENRDKENDKKRVAVIQMTLEGEFIKEWTSAREAGRALGIDQSNISKVCRGLFKKSGGFKWSYKKS